MENSGKAKDRDVIANKVAICKSYIEERPYLRLTDTYIDNGRTGTVFDRPEFNRLIVVEGMHEAIVSKDEFEAAQSVIRGGFKNPSRISKEYPLKGMVRCGNCKRVMARKKLKATGEIYYTCPYAANQQDSECAAGVRYMETDLEQTAYHAIVQVISLAEKQAVQRKINRVPMFIICMVSIGTLLIGLNFLGST